jgi:hypothetical protein
MKYTGVHERELTAHGQARPARRRRAVDRQPRRRLPGAAAAAGGRWA